MINRLRKQLSKTILLILVSSMLGFGALIIYWGVIYSYIYLKDLATWREVTSPLSEATKMDLCKKFGSKSTDDLCKSDNDAYAPDFFQEILRTIIPRDREWLHYDDVEVLLGIYKYKCEATVTQRDGTEYFVCRYDLQGDRVYPIGIFFYRDGSIMKMFADILD